MFLSSLLYIYISHELEIIWNNYKGLFSSTNGLHDLCIISVLRFLVTVGAIAGQLGLEEKDP
jgi:hypothetical protein